MTVEITSNQFIVIRLGRMNIDTLVREYQGLCV